MPGLRRSLLLALLALAAVPAGAQAQSPARADTDVPLTDAGAASARAAVLCLVNVERAARGVAPVAPESRLEAAATAHAVDMRVRSFFNHTNPDGASPGDRISAAGYAWSAYGENIAYGQRTPAAVMDAWMRSTGHCQNILSPRVTEVGIGVDGQSRGWVQNFARPSGVPAPAGPDTSAACPAAGVTVGAVAPPAPAPVPAALAVVPAPAAVAEPAVAPVKPGIPGAPSGEMPAGGAATATPVTTLPSRATIAAADRRLTATARVTGARVHVSGRLTAAARQALRVSVRRAGQSRTKTVRARGAFVLDVRLPSGRGAARVTVRAAGLTLQLRAR
jgi:uncharacterized protein YkwD